MKAALSRVLRSRLSILSALFVLALSVASIARFSNRTHAARASQPMPSQSAGCSFPSFFEAPKFGVGSRPRAVAVGDLNKDGKQDLAVANYDSEDISVLLGNGAGGFGTAANLSLIGSHVAIEIGDFNQDSNPDLAVGSSRPTGGYLSVFLGNGAGEFGQPFSFFLGTSSVTAIASGDFNQDGKTDLAVTSESGLFVLQVNAAGGLSTLFDRTFGNGSPDAITVGDFNLDGKVDMAVTTYAAATNRSDVLVLLGNGTGGFASPVSYSLGADIHTSAVVVGDLNRDSKPDLVIANYIIVGDSYLSVLLGDGTGGFGTLAHFNIGVGSGVGLGAITVGDFNQDNNLDVAVTIFSFNSISVLLGNGAGGLNFFAKFGVGRNPTAIAAGDFNHDGKADIATTNYGSNNVSVLLGSGAGSFAAATILSLESSASSIAVGDFNKDLNPDLIVGNYDLGKASMLLGNGAGSFGPPTGIGEPLGNQFVTVGDFNRDGSQDLAVKGTAGPGFYPNYPFVLLNNGAGRFNTSAGLYESFSYSPLGIGDFNRDGKQDLVDLSLSSVSVLLGNGVGGFSAPYNFDIGSRATSFIVEDFDRDGNSDLAIIHFSSTDISIFLGDGAGAFRAPISVNVGSVPFSIVSGDFNQDNKLDLAAISSNSPNNDLLILLGNGAGGFGPPAKYSLEINPQVIAVRDFNQDGKLDLVAANSLSDNISILLGDGTGKFSKPVSFLTGLSPSFLAVSDFNQDGKSDIAVANAGSEDIWILLNTCSSAPNSPPTITPVAGGITRQQGSPADIAPIATINDAETPTANLVVAATSVPSGVIVSNITNANGRISATIEASCTADVNPNQAIVFTVTDTGGLNASASVNINVTANTPPVLGDYNPPPFVIYGRDITITPSMAPVDNVSYTLTVAASSGFAGSLSIDQRSGEVTIINPGPGGTHIVTVTARDNCGITTTKSFNIIIDRTPPDISGLTVSEVSKYSARVQWTTDEPSSSVVQYVIGSGAFSHSLKDDSFRTEHSVVLQQLNSNTLYNVQVIARDRSGNESGSAIVSFTTEKRYDLFVTEIKFNDDGPASGESISISAKVKNLGDDTTTATLVFYDSIQLGSGVEVYRKTITLPALSPEQTITSPLFPVFQGRHFPYVQLIDISPSDEKAENNRANKDLNVAAPANRFAIGVSYPRTWPGNVGLFTTILTNTGSRPQPITSAEVTGVPWITLISKLPSEPVKPGEEIQLTFRMIPPTTEVGGPVDRPVRKPLTLKVTNSQSFTQDFAVDIFEGPLANLRLKVVDAITSEPIKGASLALNNSEVIWKTGDDGKPADDLGRPAAVGTASISNMVSAVAPGYSPNTVNIGLLGGGSQLVGFGNLQSAANPSQTEVTLPLVKGGLTITDITVRELTLKEIQDRGVKINDEKNTWIFDFTLILPIGEIRVSNVEGPKSPSGGDFWVWGGAGPAGNGGPGNYGISGRREYITPTQYRDTVIVIAGDVRFLKQFWDVTVFVKNSTNVDISDATVEIDVPQENEEATSQNGLIDGLKLPATNQDNRRIVSLGTVKAQSEVSKSWTIRGDKAGEYKITGAIKFKEVLITKLASTSFKVAEPKLKVAFTVPTSVKEGEAFEITIFVTNDSSVPLNYVRANIDVARLRNCDLADQATKEYGAKPLAVGETWEVRFKFVSHLTGCVLSATALGKFPGGQFEIPPIQVNPCNDEKVGPVAAFRTQLNGPQNVPLFGQDGYLISTSFDPDDGGSSNSGPNPGIVKHQWTIIKPRGQKIESTYSLVPIEFDQEGNYQVTLIVTDNEGEISSTFNLIYAGKIAIDGVEVTQAIQEYQPIEELKATLNKTGGEPPVPIIAGKPAALRIYFKEATYLYLTEDVKVKLRIADRPFDTKQATLKLSCKPDDYRRQTPGCQSIDFYFIPPEDSWKATVELYGINNTFIESHELSFRSRKARELRLNAVSLCNVDFNGNKSCENNLKRLKEIGGYLATLAPTPITTVRDIYFRAVIYEKDYCKFNQKGEKVCDVIEQGKKYFEQMQFVQKWQDEIDFYTLNTSARDHWVFLRRPDFPFKPFHSYYDPDPLNFEDPYTIMPLTNTLDNIDHIEDGLAHEMWHGFGSYHIFNALDPSIGCLAYPAAPFENWPFYPDTHIISGTKEKNKVEVGFDVIAKTAILPESHHDLMTYCYPRWTSPFTYYKGIEALTKQPVVRNYHAAANEFTNSKSVISGKYWRVSGIIEDKALEFYPIFELDLPVAVDSPGQGSYRIEIQTSEGDKLFTKYFYTRPISSELQADEKKLPQSFSEFIPAISNASQIVVLDHAVGSSRVDLQACKLEYSIVSPK